MKDWKMILLAALAVVVVLQYCGQNGINKESLLKIEELEKKQLEMRQHDTSRMIVIEQLKDSLRVVDSTKQELEYKKEVAVIQLQTTSSRVISLTHQLEQAKKEKDTVENLAVCDSLAAEAKFLTENIIEHRKHSDSLETYYQKKIDLIEREKLEWQNLYYRQKQYNDNLSEDLRQALSNTPKSKRWSVGPSAGAGIGNGLKGTAFVGITIQRSLFKF
jgi:hypothetical protein